MNQEPTCAHKTSILCMTAITSSPILCWALTEIWFCPIAAEFIQPDVAISFSKVGVTWGWYCFPTFQLLTYNSGFLDAPLVITNGAPFPIMEHFHSPTAAMWPVHQSGVKLAYGCSDQAQNCMEVNQTLIYRKTNVMIIENTNWAE